MKEHDARKFSGQTSSKTRQKFTGERASEREREREREKEIKFRQKCIRTLGIEDKVALRIFIESTQGRTGVTR